METRNNQQVLEGASIQAEDVSHRAETPPPTYEDACYKKRVAIQLPRDISMFPQAVPAIAQNDQNGIATATLTPRLQAEQKLRTESDINLLYNKSCTAFTALCLRISLIIIVVYFALLYLIIRLLTV